MKTYNEAFDDLLNMAHTEEEIRAVLDLYEEYMVEEAQFLEAVDQLADMAQTEEEIAFLLEEVEEHEQIDSDDYPEADTEADAIIEHDIVDAAELGGAYTWIDVNGVEHEILPGRPDNPEAEKRNPQFDHFEDAVNYIADTAGAAGYFEIYEEGGYYYVWYVG